MKQDKIIGLGGVGDCLIIIFKLLERENQNYKYVHLASSAEKGEMCAELLDVFKVQHEILVTPQPKELWKALSNSFDERLNVFAKGRITAPPQPYHWEPCVDAGFNEPFNSTVEKTDRVVVQVNATFHKPPPEGLDNVHCPEGRHYAVRPLVEYVKREYPNKQVLWVGTDTDFSCDFGENAVGQFTMQEVMDEIAKSKFFVGFNSVLLYWALRNRVQSTLLPDHQARHDMRIHDEWQEYLTYCDE